ncbi:MAG: hypothetical protein MK098_07910 [Marinovum sp.]|nr:hypothetical protein [Marinovum sp.]
MRPALLFMALTALAACGADGAPIRPTTNLGISIGPNGIIPNASVKVKKGPVTITVGN